MSDDELVRHKQYAITRLKRSVKAIKKINDDLADATGDGTDALMHEQARDAEELIEAAQQAMAAAAACLSSAQGMLEGIGEDIE
jgi:hypothetical protein